MASAKDSCSDESGNKEEKKIINLEEKLKFYRENKNEAERANMFLAGGASLAEMSYVAARLNPRDDQGAGINPDAIGYIRGFQYKTGDKDPETVLNLLNFVG